MSENAIENYIRSIDIQQLINQLNAQEKQILLLYYWWGYKDSEIGKLLNLSQQLVNYKRKKAHLHIKEKIINNTF
ncbi:MAG: RNA polymerase sigma factor [Atribacterota bacterium]